MSVPGCGARITYQEQNCCNDCSKLGGVVSGLTFGDTSYTLNHPDDAFTNDDERQQLQAFHDMCILEADDAPYHGSEEYSQAFEDGNSNTVQRISGRLQRTMSNLTYHMICSASRTLPRNTIKMIAYASAAAPWIAVLKPSGTSVCRNMRPCHITTAY